MTATPARRTRAQEHHGLVRKAINRSALALHAAACGKTDTAAAAQFTAATAVRALDRRFPRTA